tara:strand:- start:35097 stop:36353 length:1257 start_codon:yes stop_codon:yes gene_type:complete
MPFRFLCLITLAAPVLLLSGCEKGIGHTPPKTTILPVSAMVVNRQSSFAYPITYYGRIEPARTAALSFELPGQLQVVSVDEGKFIAAGAVIARLDTSALEAERGVLLTRRQTELSLLDRLKRGERDEVIRAARSEVLRLNVEMKRAETAYQRAKRIYATKAISREEYDEARFTYSAAIHSVEQAQQRLEELESGSRAEDIAAQSSRVDAIDAQLKQLDVQFEKSILRAPFDGVCIERAQDEGVTLSPGQTVLRINEADRLEARFSIPQSNLKLVGGAKYLEIGGRQYDLSKPRAISQVDAMTRTVDIVIPLQVDADDRVLPGQTCTVTLTKYVEADCVELPISSLVASVRGLWSCYQLVPISEGDSLYNVVKVEVSVIHTDGVRAFVTSTLPDRAIVIPDGVHKVVPGMQVRVVDESP